MATALRTMQCPDPDRAHAVHVLVPPRENKCPLCNEVFAEYHELQVHVRTHVPQLPSFVEPAAPSVPQLSLAFRQRLLTVIRVPG